MPPLRVGTATTHDMETGQPVRNADGTPRQEPGLMLLPPAPGKCQECAVEHEPTAPHDRDSLYYQMQFHARHGRWPTWTDAMNHCSPELQTIARRAIREVMTEHGIDIPEDLREQAAK